MAARTASSSSATPATKGAASAAALWMPAAASSTAGAASSWSPSTPAEREATRERHAACVAEWRRHPRWSAVMEGRHLCEDVHGGFRRGFNALVADCDRQLDAAAGDASKVKANVARFQRLVQSLEGHHRAEDELMFPRIAARHPDMKPAMDFLEKDHEYLHPLQERVLRKGDEAALREFTSFLEDHLMREEMAVVPLGLAGHLSGLV